MEPDSTSARAAQIARATAFRALHFDGPMLRLANAWSASSARVLVSAGAPAVGTTSFGVALDHGHADGELLAWSRVVELAASMVEAVDVPVTVDVEAGRGATPRDVGRTVADIIAIGAAGINLEDSQPASSGQLFSVEEQSERVAAARGAASDAGVPLFINARCDCYFGARVDPADRLTETIRRADSYAAAGADGLFVPGLDELETLKLLVDSTELPVNVMMASSGPRAAEFEAVGVRRTSQGGEPFLMSIGRLANLTHAYLADEPCDSIADLSAGIATIGALL